MGRFSSLLRSVGGEKSISSPWGRWAQGISKALDSRVDITMGSGIRIDPATAPAVVVVGPTYGWLFTVAPQCFAYCELPIHPNVDENESLILGIGWAPAASENDKQVKWTADIGLEHEGSTVASIELSKSTTVDVPSTAGVYTRSAILIPAAEWKINGVDELHVRLTREASPADPAPPGLHHIVLITPLL